ncbi:phosphodiester glycosidase family protein [Inquilinus sp. Marseille-Q2685]|uniref:phosphodiester glycosidase family protein n=1 Tax=Inquilinus sp. Marseille-Q2685 TaxID=2866581 RepID=UPI001CE3D754|nr:phosphodiester glycosidase family protein [Inquilinus sp. Marseille-Q2685]
MFALLLTAACGSAVSTPRPAEVAQPAPPSPAAAPLTPAPGSSSFTGPTGGAVGQPCRAVTFEAADYTVCELDLRRYRVGLFWQDRDGRPYGSLYAFKRAMAAAGDPPVVSMNAGMYHEDLSPVGLFVSGGRQLNPANEGDGDGNFFMKPNGVFYVEGERAGILETGTYLRRAPAAGVATQSGPLLVIDGALHPLFSDDGPSRKIRNGVGIRDDYTVVFAISRDGVSFGSFARLFRDALGCRNALYLDGSISALSAPDGLSVGWGIRVGPILAAFDRNAPVS